MVERRVVQSTKITRFLTNNVRATKCLPVTKSKQNPNQTILNKVLGLKEPPQDTLWHHLNHITKLHWTCIAPQANSPLLSYAAFLCVVTQLSVEERCVTTHRTAVDATWTVWTRLKYKPELLWIKWMYGCWNKFPRSVTLFKTNQHTLGNFCFIHFFLSLFCKFLKILFQFQYCLFQAFVETQSTAKAFQEKGTCQVDISLWENASKTDNLGSTPTSICLLTQKMCHEIKWRFAQLHLSFKTKDK